MMKQLLEAKDFIESKSKLKPVIGLTLGSGLAQIATAIKIETEIDFKDIPHFSPSTVEGHPGKLLLGTLHGIPVAALQGRVHFYEGHSIQQVVVPTRVLGLLGVRLLILTNAAGGLLDKMTPGDLMVIEDHLNFTGQNPLIGKNLDVLGPRFPDMTEIYSRKLNHELEKILEQLKLKFHRGVYCGLTGPSYETPAEVKYLRSLGVGAVGMSTVAEAIAARHMGLHVVGLSCITNVAAGLPNSKILSHQEVKDVAAQVEKSISDALETFIQQVARQYLPL